MREVLGLGLILNGKSVNSRDEADIKAAEEFILKQKPNVGAFTYEVLPLIQSGDMAASHWFVGANLFVLKEPDKLGYVVPEEGATMYQENICMLKGAPNQENALKFLEFFMRPEISVLNTTQQTNGSVNIGARELASRQHEEQSADEPAAGGHEEAADFRGSRRRSEDVRSRLDTHQDELSYRAARSQIAPHSPTTISALMVSNRYSVTLLCAILGYNPDRLRDRAGLRHLSGLTATSPRAAWRRGCCRHCRRS